MKIPFDGTCGIRNIVSIWLPVIVLSFFLSYKIASYLRHGHPRSSETEIFFAILLFAGYFIATRTLLALIKPGRILSRKIAITIVIILVGIVGWLIHFFSNWSLA